MAGRHILDGVLVANGAIEDMWSSGTPGIVCKIDLTKAYNHVCWDFLDFVMVRMGFRLFELFLSVN